MRKLISLLLVLAGCSSPTDLRWEAEQTLEPDPCFPKIVCKPMWHGAYEAAYKCSAEDPCSGSTSTWVVLRDMLTDECTSVNLVTGERGPATCPFQ